MTIAGKIQIFNAAYKIVWDLAIQRQMNPSGLGRKINDAVRLQMKVSDGPLMIAQAAFESLSSHSL